MVRRIIRAVLQLALRVFFRRIEVRGRSRVPVEGAVIFVLNHPNGLVDPAFLLCHAPRRVSFLAKAPIFGMPVIGWLARALEAIPVYRHQDEGADVSRNRETFARCRSLLKRGGTIAVCPEGVSHSGPQLRPLKTGVARIALGVAAEDPSLALKIVPAGLYYTAKTAFRSAALLYFGAPLEVAPVALDHDGEPPREAVRQLSDRIEQALRDVTLNAEHQQALATIERAERIFSAEQQQQQASSGARNHGLKGELALRRRFVAAYAYHLAHAPARLNALEQRLSRYEAELRQTGLDAEDLSASDATPRSVVRYVLTRVVPTFYLFPLSVLGVVAHYPAYRLAGYLATTLSRQQDDVVSTFKIIAALLLFPLTWLMLASLCYPVAGWPGALAALVVVPASGYVAVRFLEQLDGFIGAARALLFFTTRRRFFQRLLVERRRLHEEIVALGAEAERHDARDDHNDADDSGDDLLMPPAAAAPTATIRTTLCRRSYDRRRRDHRRTQRARCCATRRAPRPTRTGFRRTVCPPASSRTPTRPERRAADARGAAR